MESLANGGVREERALKGIPKRAWGPTAVSVGSVFILLLAGNTGASSIITVHAPFSGKSSHSTSSYFQGCGGTTLGPGAPRFNPTTGHGAGAQYTYSSPCGSVVVEIAQQREVLGLNSSAFSGSTSGHVTAKVHWLLRYLLTLNTAWGNSSQTTYASDDVNVTGILFDVTTSTTYYPSNGFDNFTWFSDVNTSWTAFVKVPVELFFNLSMSSSNMYELRTWVTLTTVSDIVGLSSGASAGIYMEPRYAGYDFARLESFSY